jgi:hypothetical protein
VVSWRATAGTVAGTGSSISMPTEACMADPPDRCQAGERDLSQAAGTH